MKLNWGKWFYDLANMLIKHVGTAGLVWGGLSAKHRHQINAELWWDLGTSLLCGAILPTIFTFFQSGLPKDEDGAGVPVKPVDPSPKP